MKQPLIGMTSAVWVDSYNREFVRAYAPNAKAIEQAGGLPVCIPSNLDETTLRGLYERLDGILLTGGPDVDPIIYGAEKHPKTIHIDRIRDDAEIAMTKWAVDENRPVFGICRGHQVFNVALGGTLIQDIPAQMETDLVHDIVIGTPRNNLSHSVTIEKNSLLANIVGTTSLQVNSIHHQALEETPQHLKITAYSPDKIIEATEVPDHPFALTVQWHPEDLTDIPVMRRLFQAFVDAARK